MADKGKVFEDLQDLVSDQLKAISFKWLARHFSVPANDAKRLLFEFAEKHRGKVSSTYLIAGWTKGGNPQHTVQLVDATAVADRRSKLDPVTSLHVYSIQPAAPKGASHLLNHDDLQAKELFLGMVKQGEENCLSDNRWSAVQCQGARRDPSLVLPAKKAASAAPAQEKPVSSVAKAIKDAAAGKPASAAAAKPDKEPEAKPNSAPAKAADAAAAKSAAAKGNGSAIASMWSKAPAKKGRKPAPKQAAAQPSLKEKAAAVDAEAFMRLNQQDAASSSGEEDDEVDVPIRRSQAGRKNALVDSDDEADEAPTEKPKAPAMKAISKHQAKRKTVLDEDPESDDDWEAPKQAPGSKKSGKAAPAADAAVHVTASKPASAPAAAAAEADEAAEEAVTKQNPGRKPRKASAGAERPAPGTVKLGDSATGPARKKVQRTTYNEKGEEVTEMVYEDAKPETAAAPATEKVAEPVVEEKPQQEAKAAAATSRSNNSAGVKRKASGGVDSKAAKKPAGKGKAGVGAGQRGIASFFAKK